MSANRTDRRIFWLAIAFLAVTWIVYTRGLVPRPGGPLPPAKPVQAIGVPADYRWTLRDLDGRPVDFATYRGKVVFLNRWATWCPPCVEELPAISNLASNSRLKDVAFLCVSTDESLEVVRRFLSTHKLAGVTVLQATDVPRAYETDGIPATFIISADGRIVGTHMGAAQWDDPEVVDFLERLARRPG